MYYTIHILFNSIFAHTHTLNTMSVMRSIRLRTKSFLPVVCSRASWQHALKNCQASYITWCIVLGILININCTKIHTKF